MRKRGRFRRRAHHAETAGSDGGERRQLVIAGSPNVGKSVLFNCLTSAYATVSNYPGTTVEVARGKAKIGGETWEVMDTPGMYSLLPATEEERVARSILMTTPPDVLLHVVDARNLERMLALTLQFIEADLPVILVVNIMDEAEKRGIGLDLDYLHKILGVPVVGTVCTSGRGIAEIRRAVCNYEKKSAGRPVKYSDQIEAALEKITPQLSDSRNGGERALALLLLQGDHDAMDMAGQDRAAQITPMVEKCALHHAMPMSYLVATRRQRRASEIAVAAMRMPLARQRPFADRLSDLLINPWIGAPVLLLVLYFGLYKFVGELGAGFAVDYLEGHVFQTYLNPFAVRIVGSFAPSGAIHDLLVGEYGIITLGLRYAVAIVLPIVTFFFIILGFYAFRVEKPSKSLLKRLQQKWRDELPYRIWKYHMTPQQPRK